LDAIPGKIIIRSYFCNLTGRYGCDRDSVTAADITIMLSGCASSFSLAQCFSRTPETQEPSAWVRLFRDLAASEILPQISSFPLTPFLPSYPLVNIISSLYSLSNAPVFHTYPNIQALLLHPIIQGGSLLRAA